MESFQDGGQQNMNSEHNEYPSSLEGSHMNPEMNNFTPGPGDGGMGPDGFSKIPDGMHPNQMQNYTGYNRGSFGIGDQHGGMMAANVDYGSQNTQFSGQYSQNPVRQSYPGMPKPSMSPVRPGLMPSGMGLMPGAYNSSQRMMSQQSGPTPTLNQLLQTPNSGQRFPGSYGEYSVGQGKGDMGGGSYSVPQQGWNGNPRSLGPYSQSSMPGSPYRNQGSAVPDSRRPSGMGPAAATGPGYPHQGQYLSPAMSANAQRYMMGQVRPGQVPMSAHGYNQQMPSSQYAHSHSQINYSPSVPNQPTQPPNQQQQMYHGQQQQPQLSGQSPPQPSPTIGQQHQSSHRPPSSQGASPRQPSPTPPGMSDQNSNHSTSSKKSEDNLESNLDNSNADDTNGDNSNTSQPHIGVAGIRPAPSPGGSAGSRSNTPAPVSGNRSGSPMPPRPPSSHLEGQGNLSHSPMAAQGFNPQMMPPPMPGQIGYGPGVGSNKMGGPSMPGGQIPPHYPQYNSQYTQGNYGRQQGMPSMQGGGSGPGMPGSYPQTMYNGPSNQMGQMQPGPNMYNNMMNRGMQNYNNPYGPGSMNMNNQYNSYNSHMGPGQGPGPGPGSGPGPGPGQSGMGSGTGPVSIPANPMITGGQGGMCPMGQPTIGGMQPGGPGNAMIPVKGAQAAAHAALMAAANSAGSRPHTPSRGTSSSPRMFGPHSPTPGGMNYAGNLGNPSLNSMSNAINQITAGSMSSVPSKPSSPAVSGTSNGQASIPGENNNSVPTGGNNSGSGIVSENSNLMSPMSSTDTQESSSRPSSTTTSGQTMDTANSASDTVGSDGSGSMPSDSTSVDSGFHSASDHTEKPPSDSTPTHSSSPSNLNQTASNFICEEKTSQNRDSKLPSNADGVSTTDSSDHIAHHSSRPSAPSLVSTHNMSTPMNINCETESSSSQTSSMPMHMMTNSNGPHYPHHPHPLSMGYVNAHGAHLMQGSGIHHHSSMSSMGYNMPSMPPGHMPNMMNSIGPCSMPSNMPPGSMPNNMSSSGMPPGNMHMHASSMANNMPPGNILNSMPHGGNMSHSSSMPNSVGNNVIGPMNIPQNNCMPLPSLPDEPPEKKKKDGGVVITPHGTAAGPSYVDEYDNASSPGWPGTPKSAADLSKLYEMGNEMDRRPFMDKLLAFLEEKGTPITAMPSISKQPLDLYRLYFCVREKGGMVEVNKGKKWKEICSYVNIGSSASAAFTLKKNYIRYLFAFECKHDRGGQDPAPILAEMEAQLERKREQKKRVPSPGSQGSSQDAFQPPSTPNSQMMEPYPPSMPPPYMQNPDCGIGPMGPSHGPNMMMSNNMIGHHSIGPHPGAMGGASGPSGMMGNSIGPNGMMLGSGPHNGAPGQNMSPSGMMGGGLGPQTGMMNSSNSVIGPGSMMGSGMHSQVMMGPNNYGPSNSMMGPHSSSMGPSPGPCPPLMGPSSNSSSVTASNSAGSMGPPPTSSSIPLPPSNTPSTRPPNADSVSVQDPFADEPNASNPAQFSQRQGSIVTSSSTFSSAQPPPNTCTAPTSGFVSHSSSTSSSCAPSFPASNQGSEQGPSTFRRPVESFPPTSSSPFPARTESGAQFPFGQQFDRERFDPSSSSHPGQQFRPSSQSGVGGPETPYSGRFPGQQPPFRPPVPGEQFANPQPFSSPGFGPRMPGPQDQYGGYQSPQQQQGSYPGVRPPLGRDVSSGPYGGAPAGGSMSQYSDWSGSGMGHSTYSSHMDGHSDSYMSGREGGPWSPMQRYQGSSGSYMPPNAPSTPPMGPFPGRPLTQRASPQARDKFLPTPKQKTGSMIPTPQFPPKKDIVFPPDSVEAVQPHLTKRRRLTHKDLGSLEAWRLMMALKSGLLAESSWALDTLNVLLFDDTTVGYFNLNQMPGLLEVLTEHFRASLIHIFSILHDLELHGKAPVLACSFRNNCSMEMENCKEQGKDNSVETKDSGDFLYALSKEPCDMRLEKPAGSEDFTMVTRQGKMVKLEDKPCDCSVLEPKPWDVFCHFTTGSKHWQKGGGDMTEHIVPCLESSHTYQLLTDFFSKKRTKKCANTGTIKSNHEVSRLAKAAISEQIVNKIEPCSGLTTVCSSDLKQEINTNDVDEQICLDGGVHSNICDRELHRNNFMKKLEIKTEPRDPELQRSESEDSLPPPDLPAATPEKNISEQIKAEGISADLLKEELDKEEKSAPNLTCESMNEEKYIKDIVKEDQLTSAGKESSEATVSDVNERTVAELCFHTIAQEDSTAETVSIMVKEVESELEEEAYHRDDPPLTTTCANQEEAGRRCVAISNIFRSLSCIPSNEVLLSRHHGLMRILGQLLMLHHSHPPRPQPNPAPPLSKDDRGEGEPEFMEIEEDLEVVDTKQDWATSDEWWWDTLEALRENTLVIFANICSHMHMKDMEEEVCLPILDGFIHWMVCPSSCAVDPLPSAPHTSMLSPQRLVLEALCKLCIHEDNVDLLLATPPFSRILLFISRLVRLLADRAQPVPREFSIVLLSRLVQGDIVAARAIGLQHPAISLLIEFLESAEQSAMAVASQQGFTVLQNNPEMMGTSLDMLRRAATTLLHLARVPENRKLFLHHQSRLLTLVMSQILDSSITQVISDVLYECSQPLPPHS